MIRLLIVFISTCFTYVSSWSAYDSAKYQAMKNSKCSNGMFTLRPSNETNYLRRDTQVKECPCFYEQTRPYKHKFIEELSLWSDLSTKYDYEYGETLYGSAWALKQIWLNQHPPDCKNAKYIISGGWPAGFGSRLHMEGTILAMAMQLGRVYLQHPDGDNIFWETNITFCRNQVHPKETLECFYMPVSNCTINDALHGLSGDVNSLKTFFMSDFNDAFADEDGRQRMIERLSPLKGINVVMTYGGGAYNRANFIPHQFDHILDCSPMKPDFRHYWYRSVATAYLARPNKQLQEYLQQLKLQTLQNDLSTFSKGECIATFVRHGDKGIEMGLLDFIHYRRVIETIWVNGLLPSQAHYLPADHPPVGHLRYADLYQPYDLTDIARSGRREGHKRSLAMIPRWNHRMNGTIFLTTDDLNVIHEADQWAKETGWKLLYTNLFNRGEVTAAKTWKERMQRGSKDVHHDLEYISILLNLQFSVECEAWVCTLASNSCRVIDELRVTVGGKLNRVFADLSVETCSDPPCLLDHGQITQADIFARI